MSALMTEMSKPQAVLVDEKFDVRQRLAQLRDWQATWQQDDDLLGQRVRQLDEHDHLMAQKAAQIASLRQRLRLQQVKQPLEIAADRVSQVGYPALRHHLVQQFTTLTTQERLLWLNNFLFVMTPDLRRLNDKIDQVRSFRSFGQQRNFLLGGESGMGKTTYLNWLTSNLLPQVEAERNWVPIVKIDAPESSSFTPKPLFQRMILECGANYLRYQSEEALLMKLILCFQKCGVELLIVDEVEHINRHAVRRRLLEVSNLTSGLPIVCASCHPFKWVAGDAEIAGRWNDYFELRQYTGERLSQLLAFIELLLPFPQDSALASREIHIGSKRLERMDGPARLIERWTGGILRDIMILILDASRRAIRQGQPRLSVELLTTTWHEIQTHQVTDFLALLQHHGGQA